MSSTLLSDAVPLVEEVVRVLTRRRHVSREEAEELLSRVRLKLVENDGAVLRKFAGGSTLRTYLTTVVHRMLIDYRRQEWGKWRPSAAARRFGPLGVRLEILLVRDGRSLQEAAAMLGVDHPPGTSPAELEAMAAEFPKRVGRHMEGDGVLATISVPPDLVEAGVLELEREPRRKAVTLALGEALLTLTSQERVILRMRFQDGFTAGEIARALHLEERPLYRRQEQILAKLRKVLEGRGITAEDVAELLGSASWELPDLLALEGGRAAAADV